MLRNLLARFPKVRVLLDHLARPELDDGPPYAKAAALFGLADEPGVFLKLTDRTISLANAGHSTAEAFLTRIVAAFGASRIAWGSNFPAAEGRLADILARSRAAMAGLDEADRRTILGSTAMTLYPGLRETVHG